MKLTHSITEDVLVMYMTGDLLGEINGIEVVALANEIIGENSIVKCAVDLSEVRYMNSNGLGILIALLTKFRNKDGELVIVHPSEQISKLFMITKLNSIFTITETVEEAIEILTKTK